MRDNLDDALRAVFSADTISTVQTQAAISGIPTGPLSGMAQDALNHYNKALGYMKKGDWANYGQELNKLEGILQRMAKKK
jgi:hypothetical protein